MSDETLRAAERERNERPDAASLSRVAFELARAGRHDAAYRAAVAAVAVDPGAAAREILAPMWTHEEGGRLWHAVPWSGFRRFGRVRSLDAPGHGLPFSRTFIELGRGVVAYLSAGELLAVDILAGRVLWRRPRLQPVGLLDDAVVATAVEEDGTLAIEHVAIDTGESTGPRRRLGCRTFETFRTAARIVMNPPVPSFRLGGDRLVVKEIVQQAVDSSGMRNWLGIDRVALTTFDLRSGAILGRFETEQRGLQCVPAGDGILVLRTSRQDRLASTAFDIHGRELWSVDAFGFECVVDDRALFGGEDPNHSRRIVDVRSGAAKTQERVFANGWVVCVGEGVFVNSHQNSLSGFDRRTLEQLWDGCNGEHSPAPTRYRRFVSAHWAVATRDAVVLVDSGHDRDQLGLVSVEPRTGEELSRVALRERPERAGREEHLLAALIAGQLVIGTTGRAETPLLVVESAE